MQQPPDSHAFNKVTKVGLDSIVWSGEFRADSFHDVIEAVVLAQERYDAGSDGVGTEDVTALYVKNHNTVGMPGDPKSLS